MKNKKYSVLETFVGAGGAHLGFKNVGFESRYVNDIESTTIETLIYNNPEISKTAFVDQRDILKIEGNEILEGSNLEVGEADVFFSGIVCKGFSLAGQRSPNDERNYFYHKQLELVEKVKPKISIIENVPGIVNAQVLSPEAPVEVKEAINNIWEELEKYNGLKAELRKKNKITKEINAQGKELHEKRRILMDDLRKNNHLISVMDDILNTYKKIGYKPQMKKLNSSWYGSYTRRERIIIVAVREDINIDFKYPEPSHYSDQVSSGFIGDLSNFDKYLPSKSVNDALNLIDYSIEDEDNLPMNHKEKTIERFKYIPEGKNIVDVMDKVPQDLRISSYYSRGSTMRLDGNLPSPTLVPGHSNFPVHPKEHRSITVREAATISGFPLDYKFIGSHSKRCEHVGNAVPVHLAEALAKSAIELLDKFYENDK